ncbi:MAG: DNA repair exonuclease [Clostridia bacterium]|nr:DNA repair exonuclease [Clostridia bacterium]
MHFRFVHAADLHLDTPFAGIGQVAPDVAAALRDASLEAWDALVDLTLREGALFLVLAGDVYDGLQRGLRAQVRFLAGVRRLADAGVRVFVVHGNHDPLEGWSAVRRWPDNVTVFGSEAVGAVAVECDGRRLATVYGISYGRAEETRNLAAGFRRQEAPGIHVGVLHCNVGGDPEHGAYAPCTVADLAAAGMDYWALGHVHRRRVVSREPWIVYPGNLQGRSPAPAERGAKGALVVECDAETGRIAEPRFVALDRIRFEVLTVDATGSEDLSGLVDAVQREVVRLREEHAGRGLLLRVVVNGRVPWAADLRRTAGSGELLRVLREPLEGWSPFAWIESVRVTAGAPLDRERLRQGQDLAAEIVRRVDELSARPEELRALLADLTSELRRPSWASVLPRELAEGDAAEAGEAGELLAEAERACLELLAGGDEGGGRA